MAESVPHIGPSRGYRKTGGVSKETTPTTREGSSLADALAPGQDKIEISKNREPSSEPELPLLTEEERARYLELLHNMDESVDEARIADVNYKISRGEYGQKELDGLIDALLSEL